MGIDGIGGGSGVPPGPGAPAAAPSAGEFKVGAPDAAAPAGSAQGSEALARLERGEISVEAYLDGRVDDAVSHLQGKLSGEQLDFVRTTLRQQLEQDPALIELVQRATGVDLTRSEG